MIELTFDEFRGVILKGTPQNDESHHAWGAVLYWRRDGKIYEERQPDIPTKETPIRWFVN